MMIKMLSDFTRNAERKTADFWGFWGIQGYLLYLDWWRRMGGPGNWLHGIYAFMRSPYFWLLPIEDISSRLFADVLVSDSPVKRGDPRDIHHLATAIPVAHFVVTDNAMVDRCRRLEIDSKWNTKLFSTRTLDTLCEQIATLN